MSIKLVVNNLAAYRSRDVVEALEGLLEAAKQGEIRGLVYIVKLGPGENRADVVGEYRRDPAKALKATFKLETMLRDDDAAFTG